jgi:hypothetical protein
MTGDPYKYTIMNTLIRKTCCLCPLVFLFFISQAQNITGTWQGNLDVQGNQIPIVFHIKKDSLNKWIAAFDSPKQNAYNLACSEVILKDDSIILMMAILNGKYAGLLNSDKSQITGSCILFSGCRIAPTHNKKNKSNHKTTKNTPNAQAPIPLSFRRCRVYQCRQKHSIWRHTDLSKIRFS